MSGSSKVQLTSEYFHLLLESPCISFAPNPNDPGQEMRWHADWKKNGDAWLKRVTSILEQRFTMLAGCPDPEWPIVKYEERFPLWFSFRKPPTPPPWRVAFLGTGAQVTIAFSSMPSEEARERLKQELIKDMAMVEGL